MLRTASSKSQYQVLDLITHVERCQARCLSCMLSGVDYVTSAIFNERGQRDTINFGNGLRTKYEYYGVSDNYRLRSIKTGTSADPDRDEYFYYWYNTK